jgi:hypothetical protein
MRAAVLLAGITLVLVGSVPALAAETDRRVQLEVVADDHARQGTPHEITVRLTDARGAPLAGHTVALSEQLRMFDYADTALIAEMRTDFRGQVTLTHVPTAAGSSRLTAEFAGDGAYAPASATLAIQVEEGVGVATPVLHVRPDPLLPRGVTAVWFIPLLLGVWLAIAAAIYHLVRIPGEQGEPRDA